MGRTSAVVMKTKLMQILSSYALAAVLMHAGSASAQFAHFEDLSNFPFAENRPTAETARTLRDELLFQRATQRSTVHQPTLFSFSCARSIRIRKI